MNPQTLEQAVAAHPFLMGINEHHVRLLADSAMRTSINAGNVIFQEGETANRFYLIESGKVVLESPGEANELVTIDVIGAGDLLGWSWLFPPFEWHFSARAVEPTNAIFFYGTVLREYCDADPSLGFELFKRMGEVMVKRLQSTRTRLLKAEGRFSPIGTEHAMAKAA
jgi:CRP/FNR family cyclic AMP-dependent transcriptional regulator